MKTSGDVWIVRDDDGEIQVFANKPTRVTRTNSLARPYHTWIDTETAPATEALAYFCAAGFHKATGIRVPKRPVRVRVTLQKERKK